MQQIKLFKGIENDIHTLEKDVNAWLKSSGAQVTQVFGNIAPQTFHGGAPPAILGAERIAGKSFSASDVLIVVVYETKS